MHVPVLLAEVLELLSPQPGEVYLDCTAGLGGHAAAVAQRLGPTGTVVLCDLDASNLAAATARVQALPGAPRVIPIHGSYSDAPRQLTGLGLRADLVLADLGFASNQMDAPERGFSFSRPGPLDMRLDQTSPITAQELVNTLPVRDLAEIIREFGEERFAFPIAEKIVAARKAEPITTTAQLADVVRSVVKRRPGGPSIDPATRTFQALRIAVNDELGRLRVFLDAVRRAAVMASSPSAGVSPAWAGPGTRVGVISFHSLEDRPVKQCWAGLAQQEIGVVLTRKPVEPTDDEARRNPRSRSAKLRVVRIGGGG